MPISFKYQSALGICIFLFFIFNPSPNKNYVWKEKGTYGYTKMSEKESINVFTVMSKFKTDDKLIILDFDSYSLLVQRIIITWLKSQLQNKPLEFPSNILHNICYKKFFFYDLTGHEDNEVNIYKDIKTILNNKYRSIIVMSYSQTNAATTHQDIVNSLQNRSIYKRTSNLSFENLKDWHFSELYI